MKKWNSFAVNSPTEIVHEVSHPMEHDRTYVPPTMNGLPRAKIP